ncbi:MAG: guanylate kinase [Vampirovibrionales bacterium]|nr:guanylate kinase [Vampirovibrionales bacterium]
MVIAGPSGVGKGTMCQRLITASPWIRLSVSATSRPPRPQEQDGVDYFFWSRAAFEAQIEADAFLEWAEYNGNFYGTPKAGVDAQRAQGFTVLLEIETAGAMQVRAAIPDACLIFLAPPSLGELARRLQGRGANAPDDIAARLAIAEKELAMADQFDALVVNDDADQCFAQLYALMAGTL